ncbi:MAG: LytTR family transcriptional regulator DNA-binding domain-containing protein [Bacteroidetes bacterium]|nr:LytTR family transcriptional regulator DNA-binding domain-containing protein [Bacteroidota bacterium]
MPAEKFCRIHRSHIVALQHIDNIEEGTVYIKHQPIPIGEQYRSNLLKMIDFI